MDKLAHLLPELVADMEGALVRLGRGDLVAQAKQALVARWTYDEFSDTTYLHLGAMPGPGAAREAAAAAPGERLSLYDELGVNLDLDERGRLCGIEILEGAPVAARLKSAAR
jgi:uncharacterized protein YuzE